MLLIPEKHRIYVQIDFSVIGKSFTQRNTFKMRADVGCGHAFTNLCTVALSMDNTQLDLMFGREGAEK